MHFKAGVKCSAQSWKCILMQRSEWGQSFRACVFLLLSISELACTHTATHHFLWGEGVHPLLYQCLHVVLSEVLALLLLFEADEAWRIAFLPLHQLLLRVGWRTLGPVPTQTLLQVPTAKAKSTCRYFINLLFIEKQSVNLFPHYEWLENTKTLLVLASWGEFDVFLCFIQ